MSTFILLLLLLQVIKEGVVNNIIKIVGSRADCFKHMPRAHQEQPQEQVRNPYSTVQGMEKGNEHEASQPKNNTVCW